MKTTDIIYNGKRLSIEVCEVWDFVRDIHSYQASVADKAAMQRHIIGTFKTEVMAEQKASEWIKEEY